MPQDKTFVQKIVESLAPLNVRSKAMFGGYGLYCDEKFVAIVSEDHLYLKQSDANPALFTDTELTPPYEGAKEYHCVPASLLDSGDWLRTAVQETADGLPEPEAKGKRTRA